MAQIIVRPDWNLPGRLVTSEKAFLNRRQFLRDLGLAGGALSFFHAGAALAGQAVKPAVAAAKYPARRNPEFNPGWRLTNEQIAGSYNNFYEFSMNKQFVRMLVGQFETAPGLSK